MTTIPEGVATFVQEDLVLRPGEALVVGVSGGPDSVCLLHALASQRTQLGVEIVVAHFNHGIRGAEADEDERYVQALCATLGVACTVGRRDVPALAELNKLSLEEAARRARYTFLAEAAQHAGARYVVVGHNADDQVETVLMHVLRGTGLAGLRGMQAVSPLSDYHLFEPLHARLSIARPLLNVPRVEIEAYCAEQALAPRQDLSNLDTMFLRNRVRLELIPLLETYNSGIRASIRRSAEVAAGDFEIVEAATNLAWQRVLRQESGHGMVFDLLAWRELPRGLRRLLVREAIVRLRPRLRDLRFDIVEQALEIAQAGVAGAKATLPAGLLMHVGYDSLTLTHLHGRGPLPDQPLLMDADTLEVAVPGRTPMEDGTWELVARVLGAGEWNPSVVQNNPDEWQAFIDLEALAPAGELPALTLRRRRPGDRFQPLGMGGQVRLTEFMINAKVPQVWRDAVPVLAAGVEAEQVVWLGGLRLDERVRVREGTGRVLHLAYARVPDTPGDAMVGE